MPDKERVEEILDWFASGDMSCGPATQDIKLISDYINQLEAEVKKWEHDSDTWRVEAELQAQEVKRLEEESAILKEDLRGIDEATKAAIAFKIKEWKEKCAKVAESFQRQTSQNPRWIAAAIRDLPEGDE